MTTILLAFCIALALSLLATPLANRLGTRFGAMDVPDQRKVHATPTPRTGGLAIFVSAYASLVLIGQLETDIARLLVVTPSTLAVMLGSVLAFGIGLTDDFRRLGPKIKFIVQILAASLAYIGGTRISLFPADHIFFHQILNYGITVFWFLLLINAINLFDGLDGLAGGVVFFACVLMVVMSTLGKRYHSALLFASLGGTVLGFLRYNFNPASIFLGDSGTYFLGYAVAAISIMGSSKSQLGASILIPVLALGVPLFDTILSPLRRFIRGKRMFQPDKSHIHHRLMELGLNTRKVVLIFYAFTTLLCLAAVIVVNLRDEQAGLFLLVVGAGGVFAIRKLGYFNYVNSDKILSWVKDVSDQTGLSFSRRSFLDLQMKIEDSGSFDDLWHHSCEAFAKLQFNFGEMSLYEQARVHRVVDSKNFCLSDSKIIAPQCSIERDEMPLSYSWAHNGFNRNRQICESCLLKLELPLISSRQGLHFGTLWLIKDLNQDPISHYTLQRIEHYRRSVVRALIKFRKQREEATPEMANRLEKPAFNILVVDDEASNLRLMEKVFMKNGYNVLTAPNGESALEKARKTAIDAAVLDIHLPKMDGLRLCSELKGIHPRAKIVATTGHANRYQSDICYKAGFDGYFPKPLIPHALVDKVGEILKTSE